MDTINEQLILILNEKKNYPYTSFLQNIKIQKSGTIYQPSIAIIDPITKKYLSFIDIKETISSNDKIELSKNYASLKKFVFTDASFFVITKKDENIYFIDFLYDPKLIEKKIEEFPPYDMIQATISNEKEKTENDYKQRQEEVLIANKNKFLKLRNGILISIFVGLMFFFVLIFMKNDFSKKVDITQKGNVSERTHTLSDSISKNLTLEISSLKRLINGSLKEDKVITEINNKVCLLELELKHQNEVNELKFKQLDNSYNFLYSLFSAIFITILGTLITVWIEGRK